MIPLNDSELLIFGGDDKSKDNFIVRNCGEKENIEVLEKVDGIKLEEGDYFGSDVCY